MRTCRVHRKLKAGLENVTDEMALKGLMRLLQRPTSCMLAEATKWVLCFHLIMARVSGCSVPVLPPPPPIPVHTGPQMRCTAPAIPSQIRRQRKTGLPDVLYSVCLFGCW